LQLDPKLPVINHDHYTVYVEHAGGVRFIHMDVRKWSKTIYKAFTKDWYGWAGQQEDVLFAMPFIDDEKMRKWAVICGFEVAESHVGSDGVTRKLYIWGVDHG
jgi:hypothetical protein